MGSVISDIKCPNCSREAYCDYYYKSGEEYVSCHNCGYRKSFSIKEESRDKPLNELNDDDWEIFESNTPYGCIKIKPKESIATQCITLSEEREFNEIYKEIDSRRNEIEYSTLSRFIDGEIVVTNLV